MAETTSKVVSDDFKLSAQTNEEVFPISDEKYNFMAETTSKVVSDDFKLSAQTNEEVFPISDEKYNFMAETTSKVVSDDFKLSTQTNEEVFPISDEKYNFMAETTSKTVSEIIIVDDDFYFSAQTNEIVILDDDDDEKYATELQFQEVMTSSLISSNVRKRLPSSSSSPSNMDVLLMSQFQPTRKKMKMKMKIQKEVGESSQSQSYFCEICMDEKPEEEMFREMSTCRHSYCRDCITQYVASKIQENAYQVKCPDPDCTTVLEPHHCRSIVPEQVLDRWSTTLCESLVLSFSRFYCPFKDCSGVLVVDNIEGNGRGTSANNIIRESECPYCHRLFCAHCKVPWHAGITCNDFHKLDKNDTTKQDLMAVELANKLRWKRCPKCSFFVEKRDGCTHIICRCGLAFCYGCGSAWSTKHICRKPKISKALKGKRKMELTH